MARRQLLYLLYTSSSHPAPSFAPHFPASLPPPPPFLFRKGCNHTGNHATDDTMMHERAPSTLEEFKRLEDEKASEGVVSQRSEKAKDGFMEAAAGDGKVKSVKESFKKVADDGNMSNTGDFLGSK